MGRFYPVQWNSFTVAKDAAMEWKFTKDRAEARLDGGKTAEVVLNRNPGMTDDPVVIKNLKYWGAPRNDGFVLMPNEIEAYRAGDKPFEFKGTNGFMITFDMNSKDVQYTSRTCAERCFKFCKILPRKSDFAPTQKATAVKAILVVDDDFAMRRGIALMLKGQGYEVFEAEDGMQALQVLGQKSIDLAIVDLFLPGQDGIEIAEGIGKKNPSTKILLVTAYGEYGRAKEAQQIFQKNYLEKSFLARVLSKKVEEILGT